MTEETLNAMKATIKVLERSQMKHDVIMSEKNRQDGLIEVIYDKLMCSWEDVYVACTRARSNLYLISNYDLPQLHSVTDFDNNVGFDSPQMQPVSNSPYNSTNDTHISFSNDLPF